MAVHSDRYVLPDRLPHRLHAFDSVIGGPLPSLGPFRGWREPVEVGLDDGETRLYGLGDAASAADG